MNQSKEHKYMKKWIELYNKGYSFRQIAKEYDVAMTTVKRRIASYVKIRPKSQYITYADEWLNLLNSGVKKSEIARMYKVSPSTVGSILSKVGVERNGNKKFLHLLDDMKKLYAEGMSLKDISEKLNLSTQLIADYLEFDGVERRPYAKACRSYDINEDLFEIVDNTDKAFILGIMWVIGNVVYDEKISRNIRLVTTNKTLISIVLNTVYKHEIDIKLRKSDNTYRKDIQCIKLKDDLIQLGFSNKGNKQMPSFTSEELRVAFIDGLLYSRLTFPEGKAHVKYLDEPLKEVIIKYFVENIGVDIKSIKGASNCDNLNRYNSPTIFRKDEIKKIECYYNEILYKYSKILKG